MNQWDDMGKWWELSAEDVCKAFQSDQNKGLDRGEAKKRLEKGKNTLPSQKGISAFAIFLEQFKSLIVWVLIAAGTIAALLGEWIDAYSIFAITVLNAALGFYQEWKSARAMEALAKLDVPTSVVIRSGKQIKVPSEEIVPGDLLLLEAGDSIAADGRIVRSFQLKTQEAALTGESGSIDKTSEPLAAEETSIGDRTNMGYRGTTVAAGKGYLLVTETGVQTELGKIASLLGSIEERQTPLQKQLEKLGRLLVYFCLLIVIAIFFEGLWERYPSYEMLMTAISLAVAAIPEGLPAVVTISLAIGMQRMARRNSLIRRLSAVETLGCTTVICTDKTGTLTENTMRVHTLIAGGKAYQMTGHGFSPEGQILEQDRAVDPAKAGPLTELLEIAALCNSASLEQEGEGWKITGDPTEGALCVAAKLANIDKENYRVLSEIPFDSERKRMSVVVDGLRGKELFVKGAPDSVIGRCDYGDKKSFVEKVEELASSGLRVLAFAKRRIGNEPLTEALEDSLEFIGIIGINDPPRREAKDAIGTCHNAGIIPIMITGDHKRTARAIGEALGMMDGGVLLEGVELEHLTDDELQQMIGKVRVFARVTPAHKLRIVDAFQKRGHVVAMTGDGVNDAPAIEQADIGIAMGKSGTDVAKSASDMVILDDNFTSIVAAVEEGRSIYDNILKFTSYLLSCNFAEILVIFLSILLINAELHGEALIILAPVQLLWINLVTDGLPAIALAMDPPTPHIMLRPPRKADARFLPKNWTYRLIFASIVIAAITFGYFLITYKIDPDRSRTAAFTLLVMLELSKPFVLQSAFRVSHFSNVPLLVAVASSVVLQLSIIYIPFLQIPLKTVPLGLLDWTGISFGVILFLAIVYPLFRGKSPYSKTQIAAF